VSQFPFAMQISSTDTDRTGVQEKPYYREEHLQEGTLIKSTRSPTEFGLPALNFRIVNNSAETAIVREVTLQVAKSQPDIQPVFQWRKVSNLEAGENGLELENIGWGPATDTKIENVIGTLSRRDKEKKTTAPFELVLGKVATKAREIPFGSLLKEQFQLDTLLESDRAKLIGTLSYSYADSNGSTKPIKIPFALGIVNRQIEPPPPAEGPGSTSDNVYESLQRLRTEGENYSVVCPVDGSLEPRKSYQFIVALFSERSAVHDFDVIVSLTNGAKVKLGHYRLEFYLPRTKAARVLSEISTKSNSSSLTNLNEEIGNTPEQRVDEEMDRLADASTSFVKDTSKAPIPGEGPETEESDTPPPAKTPKDDTAFDDAQAPKATYPYGLPVPGRPGVVRSPFLPGKLVDVTGFGHNAIVQDPYVQQLFLVP